MKRFSRKLALLLCALFLCAPAGAETFAVNAGENALLVTDEGKALTAWGEYAAASRVSPPDCPPERALFIAAPVLTALPEGMEEGDLAVLELSSFQLMKMTRSPDTAVVTNISPNHLDWHRDFDEYIAAKKRICASMPADGLLVLNYDNEHTRAFAASAGCRVRFFSRKNREAFCFIDGEGLHCGGRLLLPDGGIRLVGAHNRENYAAAYAATADLLADGALTAVARDFGGVEHRIEFVAEKNGVRYYNSSIDSSPSRTAAALRSFDGRVIVIAGGYDKKIPLDTLGTVFAEKTAGCVLMGDTAPKLLAVLAQSGYAFPVERAESMREAVAKASALAGPCGTVLLSPAAASFDKYRNFEERGNDFKAVVRAL